LENTGLFKHSATLHSFQKEQVMRSPTFNDWLAFRTPMLKGAACGRAPVPPRAGFWTLPHTQPVLSLRPTQSGVLRVGRGRLWVTLVGPHGLGPADSGDWVGVPGQSLRIAAGQHAVIEALDGCAAQFAWDTAEA
jgi:hypothetical protein